MLLRTDSFRDLDRLASQMLGAPGRNASMPIDAYRLGEEFVVEVDLPGIDPGSVDLTVEKNVLTIHAERKRPSADATEQLIGERAHGTFRRQLFLGDALDTDRIDASYRDGVLTVTLPVAERAKSRKIPVTMAAQGDREVHELSATG